VPSRPLASLPAVISASSHWAAIGACLGNADLESKLAALSRVFDGRRSMRAYTAVDEALAGARTQREPEGGRGLACAAAVSRHASRA
jgi:hypothetical protein